MSIMVPKGIIESNSHRLINLGEVHTSRYLVLFDKLTKHNFEFETLQQTKQIALNF